MKKTLLKALPMLFVSLLFAVQSAFKKRRRLAFLVVLVLSSSAAMAQVYVSPAGNDLNVGSLGSPKKTIQAGVDIATSGQTVFIAAGTYAENVVINKDNITLDGEGSGANGNLVPTAPDASVHTIITGGAGSRGIQLSGARTNVSVKDIAILGHTMEGFFAPANSTNLIVQSLQVNGNCTGGTGRGGIFVSGDVTNVSITGCAVQNNGPGASARGIAIWDNYKAGVSITNNYVLFTACCGIDLNDGTSSGVNISNNTLIAGTGGDSAIGVLGMKSGAGPNIIANNNISIAKRYGIEIKNPAGSGSEDELVDGTIVVRDNIINRTGDITTNPLLERRDLAGIAIFRRSFTSGNPAGYIDVPSGVVVKNNTITGFQQPDVIGEGYGIVAEGVRMTIKSNMINNCDIGIQRQAGNLSNYVKNNAGDADQIASGSNYFNRGNSPFSSAILVSGNTLTANTINTRDEFAANTYFGDAQFVQNTTSKINYATINLAVEGASAGNTLQPSAHTFDELVTVDKSITIDGVDKANRIIKYTGAAISSGSVTPALFKIAAPNVTIKNLTMDVDLTKIWSAIISNGDVAGLSVVGNHIIATRSAVNNAASYTDRNAVGINISGRTIPGVTNASNPSGIITFQDNIVSYTPDPTPANVANFRAALAVDNYNVLVENNTTIAVNHDVTNRFQTTVGQSIVRNNTFNGGGIEFSEPNAPFAGAVVENNNFNYLLGGFPTFALIRFKNNNADKPFIFKDNTVQNHYWLMSLENFQNIEVDGNTFTPIVNADNTFKILTINTKTISSSANTKLPIAAKIVDNTFNGVLGGVDTKAIAFYNHDNAAPQFGNIVVGEVGKRNTFNDNITTYLYIDEINGQPSKVVSTGLSGFPEYGGSISLTNTGYWATNVRADQNNFYVDGSLRTAGSLTQAQRGLLDVKIYDKKDNPNIGEILYYFPIRNLTTGEGFATIQEANDAVLTVAGNIVNVDEATYTLTDALKITKGITLQGNSNILAAKPIITGDGNTTNKALVEVDAPNVTIKNFEFQIKQTGNALIGITTVANDNFNNLTISDNTFKGMKTFGAGLVWTSFGMKLGRGSAGVPGGVPNNLVNVVRNTITYNNVVAPDLFGRGIYAFNTYGKIGGAVADKNTIIAAYALQAGELGGGAGNDFEFSYNDVPVGIVSAVSAEVGNHKLSHNQIGFGMPNFTTAQSVVRMLEIKGSRTANANVEVANNTISKYANIGIFIQRSNNVIVKDNVLTPFADAANTAFSSIVFSSKEGTSGSQSPATSSNLTITGNTFNGNGTGGGTAISFYNHNALAGLTPLTNAKVGGAGANKNTFAASHTSYIALDAMASGTTAAMAQLYDVVQDGVNTTNILPFNGDIDASYNIFGAINTETETNFDNLVAVKTSITDGVDDDKLGYVNIQPQKAFVATLANLPNALKTVPENFTLVLKNDAAIYADLGTATITKAHTFAIDNYTSGAITFANLTVTALAKAVTFSQPANVTGNFILTEGKINAPAGISLNKANTVSFDPNKPQNFVDGKVKVSNYNSGSLAVLIGKGTVSTAVVMSDIVGSSDFELEYFPTAYANTTSYDPAVLGLIHDKEYWSVNKLNGNAQAKISLVTYDFTNSGFTSFAPADATLARFDTGVNVWVNAGNMQHLVNTNTGSITSNLLTDFGSFTYAKTLIAVLPVSLLDFAAQATTGGALVKWSTSKEENNAKFELEKSVDGKSFAVIHSIAGKANSSSITHYEFLDLNFKQSAYYRLVQVDAGGKRTTYHNLTKYLKGLDNSLAIVAYPNPTTSKLYVSVATAKESVKLLLIDMSGKTLKVINGYTAGTLELDMNDVSTGTYMLKVIKASGNVSTKVLKL